ncbi:unannotated protein [freshwater metagenome]|uniref:Unannotated protein n=1 Tax=freshwater metagenome TaxID=449393 RepID=A0A6J6F4J6_9ZZZZ
MTNLETVIFVLLAFIIGLGYGIFCKSDSDEIKLGTFLVFCLILMICSTVAITLRLV